MPSLAGWLGVAEKEGPAPPALAAAQVEDWLEGRLLQLALSGPADDLKNALLRRSLGCYVAAVPDLRRKKNRHGKKWPYTHSFPPGRLARREWRRRSTNCCPLANLVRHWRTTQLASPGELEGPAGATRTDFLVYGSQRVLWPIRHTTRLSLFCCTVASAVVTQAQTFTHCIFHSQASRREAKLCSPTGPNAM